MSNYTIELLIRTGDIAQRYIKNGLYIEYVVVGSGLGQLQCFGVDLEIMSHFVPEIAMSADAKNALRCCLL
ncbi:hypothetical protein D3C76_1033480 [compost metagenome]